MRRGIVGLVSSLTAAALYAADPVATVKWTGSGDDTLYNNGNNWTGGAVPWLGTNGQFSSVAGSYTVTFPSSGYTDMGATEVASYGTVTFDTLGTWWLKPANSSWGNPTFRVGGGAHGFNIEGVNNAKAQMLMSNAVFTAFTSSQAITNTLVSGFLNFYDPDGIRSGNKVAFGWDPGRRHYVNLQPGTTSRWDNLEVRARGPENIFRINGGYHEVVGTIDLANQTQPGTTGTIYIAGGELITDYYSHIGVNKSQLGQVVIGTNGTWTAKQAPEVGGGGVGEINLTGGTLFVGPGTIDLRIGHNNGGTGTVNVMSGTLDANRYQTLVGNNATAVGHLNVFGGDVLTKYFHVGVNNGATGTVAMAGGTWTHSGNGKIGNNGIADMTVSGGSLTWINDWLMVGGGATSVGHLTLAGGNTQFSDVIPGYDGGDGTVDATGGTNLFGRIRLGWNPCVRSLLRISGGTNAFYGGDGIMAGCGGKGELEISGGDVSTVQLRIGYNSNRTESASSVLISGGFTHVNNNINVADNLDNSGILTLTGGVLETPNLRGWTGAACKGGHGVALLAADGGTVRASQSNATFLQDFDAATLGADGLTIDTAGYSPTVAQAFSNQTSVSGLLVKTGAGTLTLAGANSHASTVVADGTLALSANDRLCGHVTVTNNAVLSLVGGVTALTLESLTLGDADRPGGLALDLGDTITVTGASGLSLPYARLTLSTPDTDGTYMLFTCAGNVPASALQNFEVANPAAGKAYTLSAVYAEGPDTTDVQLTIQDKSTLVLTERTWNGDTGSAWDTAANWSDDTVPQSGEVAVFPESPANKTVNTAAGATAGVLRFDASSSYTLGGIETLTLDNSGRFGEITATAGVHEVSAPLALPRTAFAEAAAEAALTFSGAVSGNGGFTKAGSGLVTLSGANTFKGALTAAGGTLDLTDSDAFGSAAADRQNLVFQSGTLRYSGEATAKMRGFTLSADTPTNAVVLDTASDLTLAGQVWADAGALIKRGAGVLNLAVSGSENKLTVANGMGINNGVPNVDLVFPASGDSPTDGYTGFTVAEGTVRITSAAGAVTHLDDLVTIGVRTTQGTVSPALEIVGGTVYLGSGGKHSYVGAYTPSGSAMTSPALRVTDGATLIVNSLHFGYGAAATLTPEFLVDDSTVSAYWTVELANQANGESFATVRNGGILTTTANEIRADNPFSLLIDGGSVAVLSPPSRLSFYGNATGTVTVANGGCLATPKLNMESTKGVTLAFDGGIFQPTLNGMLLFRNDAKHTVDLRAGGATFEVAEDLTYTVARPLTGVGGLTKTGAGTLVLGATLEDAGGATNATDLIAGDYAGATVIEEGTLAVSNGTIRAAAEVAISAGATLDLSASDVSLANLSGEGAAVNGTLAAATLAPGASDGAIGALTVDGLAFAGATFACDVAQVPDGAVASNDTVAVTGTLSGAGVVDFGKTAASPLKVPCSMNLMTYNPANGTPVVSGWKVHGTGQNGVYGIFTAADGVISVTIRFGGTLMMVK